MMLDTAMAQVKRFEDLEACPDLLDRVSREANPQSVTYPGPQQASDSE